MKKTEKMKIQNLINQVFEGMNGKEDTFGRNQDIGDRLRGYGSKIVDPILATLFALKKEGKLRVGRIYGAPTFSLIYVMVEFTKPRHAQQLAEMLLWEEILFEKDRSIRSCLLKALKRVGSKPIISLLKEFAQKAKRIKYVDHEEIEESEFRPLSAKRLHGLDQDEIKEVISGCKKQAKHSFKK